MQDFMAYAGQMDTYGECNEVLSKLTGIDVSVMQIHRVTDTYGGLVEEEATREDPPEEVLELQPGESVYAMVDGSMIFTREDGWKEVKLGRLFKESDCMEIGGKRGWIRHSLYEAYLGNKRTFTRRFEQKVDPYRSLGERLIFITDGAAWIKNWITDAYPQATQVLDWYHAVEHLCAFAKDYFTDEKRKHHWIDTQKKLLYRSRTQQAIRNIESLPFHKGSEEQKRTLLQYYRANEDRMDYKKYRRMGAGIIGSGAIESAHRTVVQKRMKLSGQRWTKRRAQNMLMLRCTRKSDQWEKVVDFIRQAA